MPSVCRACTTPHYSLHCIQEGTSTLSGLNLLTNCLLITVSLLHAQDRVAVLQENVSKLEDEITDLERDKSDLADALAEREAELDSMRSGQEAAMRDRSGMHLIGGAEDVLAQQMADDIVLTLHAQPVQLTPEKVCATRLLAACACTQSTCAHAIMLTLCSSHLHCPHVHAPAEHHRLPCSFTDACSHVTHVTLCSGVTFTQSLSSLEMVQHWHW